MSELITAEEKARIYYLSGPWPDYHETLVPNREYVYSHIEWLPAELVQPMAKEKFPDGCYIVKYRGGGLQVAFGHSDIELLLKFIRATAGDYMGAWGIVAGRDITLPHVYATRTTGRQKPKAGVGYGKTKRHTPDLDLSELEDLFNSVDDSELSNDVMDLDQLLLDI